MHEKWHAIKFEENRARQGNVETMLAANRIPAGGVNAVLYIEIGFAGESEDSVGRVRGPSLV